MNILEAEDAVKGLPDERLFQEAQNPSGNLPQFLVVSEIQRRQTMRRRYEANSQQNNGTVKDQILMGAQPAQQASQAPQQPMPPQAMPQQMGHGGVARMASGGLAPGGMIYMADGGGTPAGRWWDKTFSGLRNAYERNAKERRMQMDALNQYGPLSGLSGLFEEQSDAGYAINQQTVGLIPKMSLEELTVLNEQGPQAAIAMAQERLGIGASPEAPEERPPSAPAGGGGAFRFYENTPQDASTEALNAASADPEGVGRFQPPQNDGGIAALYASMAGQSGAGGRGMIPEEQDYADYLKGLSEKGLPSPIDLEPYRQAALDRATAAKEEARRQGIAGTLMGLGTGLLAGDPASGMEKATQATMDSMRQGRDEYERQMLAAEQLQLQAATANRQHEIEGMTFKGQNLQGRAALATTAKERDDRMAIYQAQINASLQAAAVRAGTTTEEMRKYFDRAYQTARDRIVERVKVEQKKHKYLTDPNGLRDVEADITREEMMSLARQYPEFADVISKIYEISAPTNIYDVRQLPDFRQLPD